MIIVLSYSPPVRITEELWPVISESKSYSKHLCVRQHKDGRTIVYAEAKMDNNQLRYEGEVISKTKNVARTLIAVGERCGIPVEVIRECIANLPPIDIDEPSIEDIVNRYG